MAVAAAREIPGREHKNANGAVMAPSAVPVASSRVAMRAGPMPGVVASATYAARAQSVLVTYVMRSRGFRVDPKPRLDLR